MKKLKKAWGVDVQMKNFREIWGSKDKKAQYKLVAALCMGVLLIILSNTLMKTDSAVKTGESKEILEAPAEAYLYDGYEEKLEKKLEQVVSKIEGVGNVRIMITLSYGREIVLAKDEAIEETMTREEDQDGGKREITSIKKEDKTIITNNNPLVLKELKPKIEGIVIVAEGGGNIVIKDALIRSSQALFGVEAHKIEILKMK